MSFVQKQKIIVEQSQFDTSDDEDYDDNDIHTTYTLSQAKK